MFVLRRKSDGMYFRKSKYSTGWGPLNEAHVYKRAGHPRLTAQSSLGGYAYSGLRHERAKQNRENFDALYEVVPVEISIKTR